MFARKLQAKLAPPPILSTFCCAEEGKDQDIARNIRASISPLLTAPLSLSLYLSIYLPLSLSIYLSPIHTTRPLPHSPDLPVFAALLSWAMSAKRPDAVPADPEGYFSAKWKSWEHFLGTKNSIIRAQKWWGYEQAHEYIKKEELQNLDAWQKWSKVPGNRPKGFPSNPHRRYAGNGWKTWGDFLGTGNSKHNRKRWTE